MNDIKYSYNCYLICNYRELVLQSSTKRNGNWRRENKNKNENNNVSLYYHYYYHYYYCYHYYYFIVYITWNKTDLSGLFNRFKTSFLKFAVIYFSRNNYLYIWNRLKFVFFFILTVSHAVIYRTSLRPQLNA